jgi:predicted TIM-barrel fold metal-dependent hydrolase
MQPALSTRIFDIHVHIQPWEMFAAAPRKLMEGEEHRHIFEIIRTPDSLLKYLDSEGVERICCINYVSPDVMGFSAEVNDWIANYTRDHRDRLLPVGSVNPRFSDDCGGEIRRVLDLGMRMIKVHPPHQLIAPNAYRDRYPGQAEIYAECQARGVPVMFHTGTSVFPRARNVFADPMPIDDVAVDFPELKIILAHAGRPLYSETVFFLARRHSNVFVEISGFPPKAMSQYFPRLDQISEKVLWGTDWPSPGVFSMRRNIEQFLALGYDSEIENRVLHRNAAALFRD